VGSPRYTFAQNFLHLSFGEFKMKSTTLALSTLLSVAGTTMLAVSPTLAAPVPPAPTPITPTPITGGQIIVTAKVTAVNPGTPAIPAGPGTPAIPAGPGTPGTPAGPGTPGTPAIPSSDAVTNVSVLGNVTTASGNVILTGLTPTNPVTTLPNTVGQSQAFTGNFSGVSNGFYFASAPATINTTLSNYTGPVAPATSGTSLSLFNVDPKGSEITLPTVANDPNSSSSLKLILVSIINEDGGSFNKEHHNHGRHLGSYKNGKASEDKSEDKEDSQSIRLDDFSLSSLLGGRILFILLADSSITGDDATTTTTTPTNTPTTPTNTPTTPPASTTPATNTTPTL
jgi:hypothetical protein